MRPIPIPLVAAALAVGLLAAAPAGGTELRASVLGAAAAHPHHATLGQSTPPGVSFGTSSVLYAGFWHLRPGPARPTGAEGPPPVLDALEAIRPNPFNPSTTIEYAVADGGAVTLAVYDLRGERVRTLVDGIQPPGRYAARWSGCDDHGRRLASGLYLCRLSIDGFAAVRKMLMLK